MVENKQYLFWKVFFPLVISQGQTHFLVEPTTWAVYLSSSVPCSWSVVNADCRSGVGWLVYSSDVCLPLRSLISRLIAEGERKVLINTLGVERQNGDCSGRWPSRVPCDQPVWLCDCSHGHWKRSQPLANCQVVSDSWRLSSGAWALFDPVHLFFILYNKDYYKVCVYSSRLGI